MSKKPASAEALMPRDVMNHTKPAMAGRGRREVFTDNYVTMKLVARVTISSHTWSPSKESLQRTR